MIDKVLTFRAGMNVSRYHTIRLIVPESVGHHSANVAWLVTVLSDSPSKNLIRAALLHDVAEQHTGDIPATAKWSSKYLSSALTEMEDKFHSDNGLDMPWLSAYEQRTLKQADMLDLCLKMVEELAMGNMRCGDILHRGMNYLKTHDPLPTTLEILNKLEELWPEQTTSK
jgi:5'-deoxynucleotidase YfbR-like HD superfamily hydrolase